MINHQPRRAVTLIQPLILKLVRVVAQVITIIFINTNLLRSLITNLKKRFITSLITKLKKKLSTSMSTKLKKKLNTNMDTKLRKSIAIKLRKRPRRPSIIKSSLINQLSRKMTSKKSPRLRLRRSITLTPN